MEKGTLGLLLATLGSIGGAVLGYFGGKMQGEANGAAAGKAQAEAYKQSLGQIEPPKVPSGNIEPTGQVQ